MLRWKRWARHRVGSASAVIIVALTALAAGEPVALPEERVAHRVQLRVGMQGGRFNPARVVATVGDSLRFELEAGGPHNVAFDPDSIPAGALEPLARHLGTEPRFLVTPQMLIDRGETFTLSLEGLPPGIYRFYCTPHLGNGMEGELVLRAR